MNLTTARDLVRRRLKSGGTSARYGALDLDDGIRAIGNRLQLEAACTRSNSTVSMQLDSEDVDFSALTGFRPGMIVEADVYVVADGTNYTDSAVCEPLELVSIAEILHRKARWGSDSSVPRLIAWTSHTDAVIWPPPKADGTLTVLWSPPFTTWTYGVGQVTAVVAAGAVTSITVQNGGDYTSAPAVTFTGGGGSGATATAVLTDNTITSFSVTGGGSLYTSAPTVLLAGVSTAVVTFNLDDDLLDPALAFGASLIPQLTEVEAIDKTFRSQLWKDHVALCRGRGGLGAKSIHRGSVDSIRGRGW